MFNCLILALYPLNTNNPNSWTYHTLTLHIMRFKHIFTIFTHISFPCWQTTSITMTCVFVTYPRISKSHTAILWTSISIQADSTLCEMKFIIAAISHLGHLKDVYLMRITSVHTVSIFILRHILITYVCVWYDINLHLILNLVSWCIFNGKKWIVITFWRSNKASLFVSLNREETLLEINCSHEDIM